MGVPVVSFTLPKHEANATSNNPAMIKIIQFIFHCFLLQSSGFYQSLHFTFVKKQNKFKLLFIKNPI